MTTEQKIRECAKAICDKHNIPYRLEVEQELSRHFADEAKHKPWCNSLIEQDAEFDCGCNCKQPADKTLDDVLLKWFGTNEHPATLAGARQACLEYAATLQRDKSLALTQQEIRHLALFCGMVVAEPTEMEKEDERECKIVIAPWPTKGVKGDDEMLPIHKHIAYLDEYPEEGCIPLGEPIDAAQTKGVE